MEVQLVNSSTLAQHAGKTVRIWGALIRVSAESALIKATDEGQIEVSLSPSSELPNFEEDALVEVVARVTSSGDAARELQSYRLPNGAGLNRTHVQKLIELQQHFPELYGGN